MFAERKKTYCVFVILLFIVASTDQIHADNDVKWTTYFEPKNFTLHMHDTRNVNVTLSELNVPDLIATNATIKIVSDTDLLVVNRQIPLNEIINGQWSGQFTVAAAFLGRAQVYVRIERNGSVSQSSESLKIVIIREERLIDTLFTISVASLVSILYINFGAALDLQKVRVAFVRPIGPSIALFCHFLVLPIVSHPFSDFRRWKISKKKSIFFCVSGKLCSGFASVSRQCWHAVGIILYWRFTGRWCIEYLDRYSWWKYWFVGGNDNNEYICRIRYVCQSICTNAEFDNQFFFSNSCSLRSHDAIMDTHTWQNHIRSWKHSRSVRKNFNICHSIGGPAGHWTTHSAILSTSSSTVSAHTETVVFDADSVHCDICHHHQFIFVQIIHMGGELKISDCHYTTIF